MLSLSAESQPSPRLVVRVNGDEVARVPNPFGADAYCFVPCEGRLFRVSRLFYIVEELERF